MRMLIVVALAGCSAPAAPAPRPAARPVPVVTPLGAATSLPKSCTDAAFGIDRGAKDLHPVDHEVVPPMRARCVEDAWSQRVIECFAAITADAPERLEHCVAELPAGQREPLIVEIRGSQADATAELAEVVTKLTALQVGIASCDKFVEAVRSMMTCPGMAADVRIQLGTETVEAWSLPMHKVSIQDKAKLAGACTQSLTSLRRHASDLACTL